MIFVGIDIKIPYIFPIGLIMDLIVSDKTDIEHVVDNGFCIGCGVCSAIDDSISVNLNKYGELVANVESAPKKVKETATKVCPFASIINEDDVASELFPDLPIDNNIGCYRGLYAGYSVSARELGSSGGIITHLLLKLFQKKIVDKIVLVSPASRDGERGIEFKFQIVENIEQLMNSSTSFYYPVTYSRIVSYIKNNPGKYAITGTPCFHKAIRLLRKEVKVFDERIKYQIGLVCGQMKSTQYFEYLLRRCGAEGEIESACFRRKDNTDKASNYYFEALTKKDQAIHLIKNKDIGVNWGMGLFKPKACDYCDDVFSECADIAVMDAWLPRYINDGRGMSLIVSRDEQIDALLKDDAKKERLNLEDVSLNDLIQSQSGGLRHRRQGLSYRLKIAKGWTPTKRVDRSSSHKIIFKLEQYLRILLRILSRRAMYAQVRSGFKGLFLYNAFMSIPVLFYKVLGKLKRFL